MARYIAKNLVWSGLAKRCEVALSYAIGKADPVAVSVNSFGTSEYSDERLCEAVKKVFCLRPAAIIDQLRLRSAIYADTAAYGHFNSVLFPWESGTDRYKELRKAVAEYDD